jgi:hypothetical protein
MKEAKSSRLNDDVAVVEFTLHVQSSAGGREVRQSG